MRILDKYLIREMLLTWSAVTLVLLVIMVGNVLARSLSKVTEGVITPDVLLTLVGIQSINLLVTLIPLGLYLGILLAHGRFYRDNEMSVMHACGVGWRDIFRPTVVVGLIGVILISLLTVFASPWSARYEQKIKAQLREQSGVSFLSAGKFVETSDGRAVFFTQDINSDKTRFEGVFMVRNREGKPPAADVARIADYQVDAATGNEYLVFTDGESTVGQPGEAGYTITRFKRQGVLRPQTNQQEPRLRTKGMTLEQLRGSSGLREKAELQWRISIPLAALLLAMLAVPLSYTSPREGRFSKIAIAILLYIPYANLLVLSRKWIAGGELPASIGLWPVHFLMIITIAFCMSRRVGWKWLSGSLKNRQRSVQNATIG